MPRPQTNICGLGVLYAVMLVRGICAAQDASAAPGASAVQAAGAAQDQPNARRAEPTVAFGLAEPAGGIELGYRPRFTREDPRVFEQPVHLGVVDSALTIPLESLGLIALVTYTGFKDWKWGTASFRFQSEGWFKMSTGSGGMDKVGHAFGAYVASELLYWRLRANHDDRQVISVYPALFGTLLYLYIETFDGYSVDHGFAYEDVIMNTSGVLFSLLRNTFPYVRRTFDFRLEYFPSRAFDFRPIIDYEGQKFLGVIKLAGLPKLEQTPLRFFELLCGYYTRGFDKDLDDDFKTAHVFLGVGISLEQLLFVPLEAHYGAPFGFMGLASNYFQLPHTYASVEHRRTAPTGR